MRRLGVVIVLVAVAGILSAHGQSEQISLPPPERSGDVSVEEALQQRTSVRSFTDRPLPLGAAGQLLWAAAGKTVDGVSGPTRAPASAGGLYPITAYLVAGEVAGVEPAVYRYEWREHALSRLRSGDVRGRLQRAALNQSAVGDAPAVIVLGANYEVTRQRYGERGVERYVHMDAGHAAQNVALQAETLDLALVPIGAFQNGAVGRLLGIDTEPLYLIPVGRRR
jgi:SagB-type dehydrogenase family enzyme